MPLSLISDNKYGNKMAIQDMDLLEKIIFDLEYDLAVNDDIDIMEFHLRFLELENHKERIIGFFEKLRGGDEGIQP